MAGGTLIIAAAPTYAAIGLGAPLMLARRAGAARVFGGRGDRQRGRVSGGACAVPSAKRCLRRGFRRAWACPISWAPWWRSPSPHSCRRARSCAGAGACRSSSVSPSCRSESTCGAPWRRLRRFAPRPSIDRGARRPLRRVFREHAPELAAGFGISILWAAAVYVLLIFMPVFLQRALGFTPAQAFGSSLAENVVFVIGCFAFGALADRVGPLADAGVRGGVCAHLRAAALCVAGSFSLGGGADRRGLLRRGLMAASFIGRRADDAVGTVPHFRSGRPASRSPTMRASRFSADSRPPS